MFTDRATVKLIAGKGGNGVVAWRREKYIAKGGPTGGNGGPGASVILKVSPDIYSLDAFRNRRVIRADSGGDGGANRKTGKKGQDLVLQVPRGTLIRDTASGEILVDFTENGQTWVACSGGKGGRGNETFKSPTNQAPNKCTPGTTGEEREIELELKLIADVGLVGFPNAGKSTLISLISYIHVKIAPYPFTTLRPNLGYIEFDDFSRVVIADIPGIIAGASTDRGLGLEFLRHIERTKVLIYLLDASGIDGRDPLSDFAVLRQELKAYDSALIDKPFIVALNKVDTDAAAEHVAAFRAEGLVPEGQLFDISALGKIGVEPLVNKMRELAQKDGKRFY